MNEKYYSLLEKLKILIDCVGSLDSKTICLTAERFVSDISSDVFSGNTDKVPDEVWDFMKTLPREVQMFMLSAFGMGIAQSERVKQKVLGENGSSKPDDILTAIDQVLKKQATVEANKAEKGKEENSKKTPLRVQIFPRKTA